MAYQKRGPLKQKSCPWQFLRNARDIYVVASRDLQNSAREKQQNAEWKAKEWEKNPDRIKILGLPVNIESIEKTGLFFFQLSDPIGLTMN